MEEHLRKTHMYVVRPDENVGTQADSSEDLQWKIVEQLVNDYMKVHPQEMRDILIENKALRESMANEHGSSKEGIRWGFRLPPGLVRTIERRFSGIFTEKRNIHKFMERFPGFRVAETT